MREIKFRAWVKKSEFMLPDQSPGGPSEEVVYMQYTGLKDMNGRELYEGDILPVYAVFADGEKLSKNVWIEYVDDHGLFCIAGKDPSNGETIRTPLYEFLSELDENVQPITVIGNIYENPDLLEARQ